MQKYSNKVFLLKPWGEGGYSHILAVRVCAAGKGMVFKPLSLVLGSTNHRKLV